MSKMGYVGTTSIDMAAGGYAHPQAIQLNAPQNSGAYAVPGAWSLPTVALPKPFNKLAGQGSAVAAPIVLKAQGN